MLEIIEALKKRYATKVFDAQASISLEQKNNILESIRLTATSYGLQPFRVVVVEDKELQSSLVSYSYNQSQVAQASMLLVFAIEKKVDNAFIDNYVQNICDTRLLTAGELTGFETMMKQSIVEGLSSEQRAVWAAKQAYIALGTAMSSVAQLGLDSCPMEGFVPDKYDELLGLEKEGLASTVVLAVGKRSKDDVTQNYPKVRRSADSFFIKRIKN